MNKWIGVLVIVIVVVCAVVRPVGGADDEFKVFFHSYRDEIVKGADYDYIEYGGGYSREDIDYSKKGEIYVMNPDGSGQERLTNNSEIEENVILTDEKIIYVVNELDNKDIAWMNYEGDDEEYLCEDLEKFEYDFTIDPDYKKIVFVSVDSESMNYFNSKYNEKELYLLDLNTMEQTRLTDNDKQDCCPEFFPGKNKIIFKRPHNQRRVGRGQTFEVKTSRGPKWYTSDGVVEYFGLFTLDLNTMEEKHFFPDKYDYDHPVVSPDGNYVASSVEKLESKENFVLFDKEGNLLFEFSGTSDAKWCDDYKFTSDSSSVAVLFHGYEKTELYLFDIETGFPHYRIVPEGYYVGSFDFSPDMETVYFSAIRGNFRNNMSKEPDDFYKLEIYRIGIDGEGLEQLTNNDFEDFSVRVLTAHYGE